MTADLDLVIPIHDVRRNIERTIESVRKGFERRLRVIVVAHNLSETDLALLRDRLQALSEWEFLAGEVEPYQSKFSVDLVSLNDGIPSPAGPWNKGMEQVQAPWFAMCGSDDTLEPGALQNWLATAQDADADVVVGKLIRADGYPARTPPVRSRSRKILDPVKDRLYYRGSPMPGVYRTSAIRRIGARMAPGCGTGEDISFLARVWSLLRVTQALSGPAYVELADAPTRATTSTRPMRDDLLGVMAAVEATTLGGLSASQKRALGTKLLRKDLVDHLGRPREWDRTTILAVREAIAAIQASCPGSWGYLARSEASLLSLFAGDGSTIDDQIIKAHLAKVHKLSSFGSLMSTDPLLALSGQAPLRYRLASRRVARAKF